jgi:hypothetical protein
LKVVLIRRAIISGCAVALLATACSSSGSGARATPTTRAKAGTTKPTSTTKAQPGTTRPAGGTVTTTPTVTTVPQPQTKDLILGDVGPGFVLQPDEIADTGPTNIDKAANDETNPQARKVLQATRFVDGYQRQWKNIDTSGNTNNDFIFLYQFETPSGAEFYAQQWRQTLVNTPHPGVPLSSFSPPEIPGAMGLSSSTTSGSTGIVIFSKGNFAVQTIVNSVNLNRGDSPDQTGAATALALLQYNRLP